MARVDTVADIEPGVEPARLQRERDLYATGLAEITLRYEQKIQELSVLRRLADLLRDCTELDEIFRRLFRIVQEELGTGCSLYLADDSGRLALRARCVPEGPVELLPPGHLDAQLIPPGAGPLGETFSTGRIQVVRPLPSGTPGWFPEGTTALFTAPLGPESGCMGVIALHEQAVSGISDDATRLLPILATHFTIAVENAALYRRLKQHSDTLEARVRERTAALEHVNGELEAAARQRSQFFTHFSHELRSPLNSILGFSEMLLTQMHGPLTDAQRRYVRHVYESGTLLLQLISDILDLAKVEAGRLSLQVQPMAIAAAIEQALGVMQPQASSKALSLEGAIAAECGQVRADPARVHQILLNLISNAIKFTPEGGAVTVSARSLAEDGSPWPVRRDAARGAEQRTGPAYVEVAVLDTGVGIRLEEQAPLFQDFAQVADGRHQGTGLGLSLTRRLVALHGGQIGLVSARGQGSRFWFTLPVGGPPDDSRPNAKRAGFRAGAETNAPRFLGGAP